MKIKKFRLKPRAAVVTRILKSIMGVKALPSDIENILVKEIENFRVQVVPSGFYQSWSRENIPAGFQASMEALGIQRPVAVSALVATIGSEPEEQLSALLMNGETQKSQLMTAIFEESADLSFQFLLKLLTMDAKADDCEILEPIPVVDPALLQETLTLLDAHQEEVTLDSAFHLSPRFTRIGLVAWSPLSKKKRVIALPKKRSV